MDEEHNYPVPSEFDRRAAQRFLENTLEQIEDLPAEGRVVIDFSGARYVSSSGISAVIRLYKECRESGREMVLRAPSTDVRSILELAGLDRLVKMLPDAHRDNKKNS